MLLQGIVGPSIQSDGSTPINARMAQTGELIVSENHGRFHEPAVRGKLFVLDSDSVTLAAANATKSAAGTIKFINGFYNPIGSGVNVSILFAKVATVSGTPAGGYFWNLQNMGTGIGATVATGTVRSTIQSQLVTVTSAVLPLVNIAIARTDAATTAFTQFATFGGPAAIAAGAGVYDAVEEVAGRIVIGPGFACGLTAVGAGTSHVVQSSIFWEEVPIR